MEVRDMLSTFFIILAIGCSSIMVLKSINFAKAIKQAFKQGEVETIPDIADNFSKKSPKMNWLAILCTIFALASFCIYFV